MIRNISILAIAALVIALPFIFQQKQDVSGWKPGDPEVIIISPHNEAIRYEFAYGFSRWHQEKYGSPVKVDWRTIGGTTEIMRYLAAEYVAAFRSHWITEGNAWPEGGGSMILDGRFKPSAEPPIDIGADAGRLAEWELKRGMHQAFRGQDDAAAYGCRIDLFFGGGVYDHGKAAGQGMTVAPWPADGPPGDLFATAHGTVLLPGQMSGETWREETFFGTALSTFGICYNLDRIKELGLDSSPRRWADLADPRYFGQIGVADPTKSGSIAKAFEMIIHEQCHQAVGAAGFAPGQVADFEARIHEAGLPGDKMPAGIPAAYQAAIEEGWRNGLFLVQLISANARYFTDSSGKIPIDVSTGDAAAGLAIDFYGRYQAEMSKAPDGKARMEYVTPSGGSAVSADPISLLRGAPNREVAIRFIAFVLGEEGQRLWNYAPGTPGGPVKYALRRLPVRRDFYPGENAELRNGYLRHKVYTTDALGDPAVNPYALAEEFIYYPRWTARHFGVHRDLICAMGMDAGEELRAAWRTILANGGPAQQPEAMTLLKRLPDRPETLSWESAMSVGKRHDRIDIMREWTVCFRKSYNEAKMTAKK